MFFRDLNCMIHIIQEGDTLYSISRKYNIPLTLLFKANPFADIYNLQIGDEICVPVLQPMPYVDIMSYVVEEGDTLDSILERFAIDYEDLLQFNNLTGFDAKPGEVLQIPIYQ